VKFYFFPLLGKIGKYRASVLSLPSARQPSRDIPADAGFLRDKASVLGDTIKWTPVIYQAGRRNILEDINLNQYRWYFQGCFLY
jgi:hypothetical protein